MTEEFQLERIAVALERIAEALHNNQSRLSIGDHFEDIAAALWRFMGEGDNYGILVQKDNEEDNRS